MCVGFSGAEIFICLGDPSMLLTKLEKPLFFRPALPSLIGGPSADIRLGLIVPVSDLGGVISTAPLLPVTKVGDCRDCTGRRSGDVFVWVGGAGRAAIGRAFCMVKGCD